jgi:hypothetical protein
MKRGRRTLGFLRRVIEGSELNSPVTGTDPIVIDDLVSPLRYDILVRQQYFEFLAQHHTLYDRDFAELVERSRKHPYFVWFTNVLVPQYMPDLLDGHDGAIRTAFADKVASVVDLYRSFLANGYDWTQPVSLRTARVITATATGKRLRRRIYPGDGCHRLALLRLTGAKLLTAGAYELQTRRIFRPRDHTAALVGAIPVQDAEYCRFLSLSYDHDLVRDVISAERAPGVAGPNLPEDAELAELRHIVRIDMPRMATTAQSPS